MDMNWGDEPKDISQTTMGELHKLCESFHKIKSQIDGVKDTLERLELEKKENEAKIINLLNEFKMPSIKNEFGNFIISNRFTVQTPKTPEEKSAFFSYLKELGIFDELISVNSQTLNGWYRQEMDAALDRGEVNFMVPGIAEPKMVQTLSLRKK